MAFRAWFCVEALTLHSTAIWGDFSSYTNPILKRLIHLSILVDPSHAAGRRELVAALAHTVGPTPSPTSGSISLGTARLIEHASCRGAPSHTWDGTGE